MQNVGQVKVSPNGKFQLWFRGSMVTEVSTKYQLTSKIKNGYYADIGLTEYLNASDSMSIVNGAVAELAGADITPLVEKFSVEERFNMVRDVVAAVGRKEITSAILTGEGGLGKSDTMLQGMALAGLTDINEMDLGAEVEVEADIEDDEDSGVQYIPENAFVQIKGNMSARVLYETLYTYNNRTIVFDDCDKVLFDSTAEMIFKGALDSNKDRWITWGTRVKSSIPQKFNFQGTVVFITNRPSTDLDQALLSRSTAIDLSMTRAQKIDRMKFIAMSERFMPQVNKACVRECMQLVEQLQDSVTELNVRTLIKAINLKNSVPNWQRTFEFSACR